jgi:hypothetical protein
MFFRIVTNILLHIVMENTIELYRCYSGEVAFTYTAESATVLTALRAALDAHVDPRLLDLRNADLEGGDFSYADLHEANLSYANLQGCTLYGTNFVGADLTRADLKMTKLVGANLSKALLLGADLRSANLLGANLYGAALSKADLRRANVFGDALGKLLTIPDLDGQILALVQANPAALEMNRWHTCATTHCRAGWAITLAGAAGLALEGLLRPCAAAALIYAASYPTLPVPNFNATNEDALTDIRARASLATLA